MMDRKMTGPLLMPITEKYKEMGTTVVGKIESGRVKKGQTVMIMPSRHMAEVTGIFLEEDEVNAAVCGDNVRLRLKNVEEEVCLACFSFRRILMICVGHYCRIGGVLTFQACESVDDV